MLDRVIPARKEASIHLSSYSYIRAREEKGRKVGKVKEAEVEAELSRVVIIPPPLGRGETGGEPIIKLFRPRLTLGRGG